MRILRAALSATVLLGLCATLGGDTRRVDAAGTGPQSAVLGFDVQRVAEGVYAAIRKEPPGLFVDSNVVFIINDEDVVVVDANLTPGSARESLAALRKLTNKPVSCVVNTHWHQDHVVGDQVYAEAFPGVEIIAHARTRDELIAKGEETKKLYATEGPKLVARLRERLQKNESVFGGPMAADEREAYASDIALIERYVGEIPEMKLTLPTMTFEDHLTLQRGARTIDIRYLGRGHTDKDVVVHLPKEGILITGDLVVAPVPLIGDQSYVGDWAATLEKLRALKPSVIVPGHGPVMRDDGYVKLMIELLASIKQQVDAAVARGATLEETQKSVDLDALRKRFTGDARELNLIFANYPAGAAVAEAYLEATGKR